MASMLQAVISLVTAAVMLMAATDSAGQQQAQQREQVQQRTQERAGKREIIPGSELMTSGEREAYRQRYAAAKTEAEKEQVRAEHVKAMEERARLRGLQLVHPVAPKGGAK
jgi:ABC-type transport system involved in cytochrome bd biosynthesis fused ATPase/permease subunit